MGYKGIHENRTFGAEFELLIMERSLSAAAERYDRTATGLYAWLQANNVYVHRPVSYHGTPSDWMGWKMERDGSIRTNNYSVPELGYAVEGIEVITPVLIGTAGLGEVRRVLKLINDFGTGVNRTCGLHVHHSVSDLSKEQLVAFYELYRKAQKSIDQMLPRSRRDNAFCSPLTMKFSELKVHTDPSNQYGADQTLARYIRGHGPALNFGNYVTRGTVEFRQHSGTLDYDKFFGWFCFGQGMIDAVVEWNWITDKERIGLRHLLILVGFYSVNYAGRNYEPDNQFKAAKKVILGRLKKFSGATKLTEIPQWEA
jgi:hypothetical protein